MRRFAAALAVFVLLPLAAHAEKDKTPTALKARVAPGHSLKRVVTPPIDRAAVDREDKARESRHQPPRFAVKHAVRIAPDTDGTWERVDADTLLWRLRIVSPGVVSQNLGFTRYRLPEGARLSIYSTDYKTVVRPFTATDNKPSKQLWTPIVPGDDLIVELTVPESKKQDVELELGAINRGYRQPGTGQPGLRVQKRSTQSDQLINWAEPESKKLQMEQRMRGLDRGAQPGAVPQSDTLQTQEETPAFVDVVCPEGDPWRDQIRSVAMITIEGFASCSGSLVADAGQDLTPYFLTANHCIDPEEFPFLEDVSPAEVAASIVVYWNFESSTCRKLGPDDNIFEGDGSLDQFQTGTTLRAQSPESDFALVELDDFPDPAFDVFWAGWDNRAIEAESATGIHHPYGLEKRISFTYAPTFPADTTTAGGVVADFMMVSWDLGIAKPGSSGSPLFNQDHRVVGQLGFGFFGFPELEKLAGYGRLASSWNLGSTAPTRLRDWLDPQATGAAVADGTNAYPTFVLRASPSTQSVCAPAAADYPIDVLSVEGYSAEVALGAEGLPSGATAAFSTNPVPTGGSSTLAIQTGSASAGSYAITLTGTSDSVERQKLLDLDVFTARPPSPVLVAPHDTATDQLLHPTLRWSASGAENYQLEVASDPGFATIVYSAGTVLDNKALPIRLQPGTDYFWRVRAENACGNTVSATFRFRTLQAPVRLGNNTEDIAFVPSGPLKDTAVIMDGFDVLGIHMQDGRGRKAGKVEKLFNILDSFTPYYPFVPGAPTGLTYVESQGHEGFVVISSDRHQYYDEYSTDGELLNGGFISWSNFGSPYYTEGITYLPSTSPTFPDRIVVATFGGLDTLCPSGVGPNLQVLHIDGNFGGDALSVGQILPAGPLACAFISGVAFKAPNQLLVSEGNRIWTLDFDGNVIGDPVTVDTAADLEGLAQLPNGQVLTADYAAGKLFSLSSSLTPLADQHLDYPIGIGVSGIGGVAWDSNQQELLISSLFTRGKNPKQAPKGLVVAIPAEKSLRSAPQPIVDLDAYGLVTNDVTYLPDERRLALANFDDPSAFLLFDHHGALVQNVAVPYFLLTAAEYIPTTHQFAVQGLAENDTNIISRTGEAIRPLSQLGVSSLGAAFFKPDDPSGGRILSLVYPGTFFVFDLNGEVLSKGLGDRAGGSLGFAESPPDIAAINSGPLKGAFTAVDYRTSSLVIFRLDE